MPNLTQTAEVCALFRKLNASLDFFDYYVQKNMKLHKRPQSDGKIYFRREARANIVFNFSHLCNEVS